MGILKSFNLDEKVSIVTGGGDGLGKMMALGLAEAGSHVIICSRFLFFKQKTAYEIEKHGVKALALKCDLSNEDEIVSIVEQTLGKFGKIDILINNSGRTWGGLVEEFKLEDWQKVMDVNITGTFLFCQKAGVAMIKQKRGKIINISSYAGLGGTDPQCMNAIPYNTSKGAVITFTKDLATKWGKYNINVNAIAPGWFPSRMTKWTIENKESQLSSHFLLKRFGEPQDIKSAAVFLSSDASNYITGHVLSVDGGLTVWF